MNSNNKNKVLITGGGGFLGRNIAKLLISKNYEVYSFQRNYYPELEKLGVKQIIGDLLNFDQIRLALTDIKSVIHTASKVGMNGSFDDFYKANFIGTKNLIISMKEMGIKNLVYTSTPSVVFGKDDLNFVDESTPYPKKFLSHYAHTKKLAEEYVLQSIDENFFAVALRPHLIFGPGDTNLIPRVIEARKKNKLKIVGDGKNLVDVIYVENAAYAHYLALEKLSNKISGHAYFIGQGPVNLWTFTNQILLHFNLTSVDQKIPLNVAYTMGFLIESVLNIFKLNHIHPPMSRFIALQLGKSHYFNHDRATKELGFFNNISIQDGIKSLF